MSLPTTFFIGRGGGSVQPYPMSITMQSASTFQSGAGDLTANNDTYYSWSGYYDGPSGYTKTGDSLGIIANRFAAAGNGVPFRVLEINATEAATLQQQDVILKGCRGGYANRSGGTMADGGDGLTITATVDFAALYSAYNLSGTLYMPLILGTRGIDMIAYGSSPSGAAASGGGASVLCVKTSANNTTFLPIIVASGGGGAYQHSSGPDARSGLDAFLPSNPSTTTYLVDTQYDPNSSLYQHQSGWSSTARPWLLPNGWPSSTGSSPGTSWAEMSRGYDNPNSYAGKYPSLQNVVSTIYTSQGYTPWNIENPNGNDNFTASVSWSSWGGGGGGAYGGGGGAGYYGGWQGHFDTSSNVNFGKARGGQGYIDPTYATLVSSSTAQTDLGHFEIAA